MIKLLYFPFILLFILISTTTYAQPCSSNGGLGEDPCTPIPLTVNSSCAFTEARTNGCGNFGNPSSCNSGTKPDVWGVFTTTTVMNITVRHNSDNKDMTLHVFTLSGSCSVFTNLTQVACSDNIIGLSGNEDVVLPSLAAGTYYVRAEAKLNNGSNGDGFCVFGTIPGASTADYPWPGLDLGTVTCPGTTSASGNTTGANIDCGISDVGDHIYEFTLGTNADLTIDVCSASWDTELHLFSLLNGNCNAGPIETDNDDCGLQSTISIPCLPAGTYVAVVEGDVGDEGAYTLNITTSNCGCVLSKQDCIGGTSVCNNTPFSGNSSGFSNQELNSSNNGCLTDERQSSWYFFEASSSGNIEFTISPSNVGDDYDFAVWGPFPSGSTPSSICPPSDQPLRCSYSSLSGNTGLLNGATDNTEGAGGDKFVEDIVATAGDVYILLIDNYSTSSQPFDLNWNLSNGASLDCTPLPIDLLTFNGLPFDGYNKLFWSTSSEINNEFFIVEKSLNGTTFKEIGKVNGSGNSSQIINYEFFDENPYKNISYYRLKQIDYNGQHAYSNTIAIKQSVGADAIIFPNPTNNNLNLNIISQESANYNVSIISLSKIIFSESIFVEKGNHIVQLDAFKKLSQGLYFVQIQDEKGNTIKIDKIVKN